MPAHIYNRVGRYADSIEANRAAIAADEAFLARAGDAASPLYRYGYAPHNVHFLLVAAQSAGLGEEAVTAAEQLADMTSDELASGYAWVQAIGTARFTVHAQFSDPATILALPEPQGGFPFVRGFRHYARGLAFVRAGDLAAAQGEREALLEIITTADLADLEAQFLPARDVLGIAQRIVGARIAEAEGQDDEALALLNEAVVIEATIPYMEPSYWYAPVHRTLGAVLLGQGRAREARDAFQVALDKAPRDAWAQWGLWRAWMLIDSEGPRVDEARATFLASWLGEKIPELEQL
jgi:tetratricopeptide (TPR) repeat protein